MLKTRLKKQTLLRHFGIPYITAPMEAEAQCAKLAQLGLVDGIITDDSDVFLFGGVQCFKNIFNDAKYAECFLLADVERELMLTRERLISLAYFLGSDYTLGLPGIGPVMGLEILANFPGERGLYDFKEWWGRVQKGNDTEEESGTKWRKSFKKRFLKSIYLTADWPDPLVVSFLTKKGGGNKRVLMITIANRGRHTYIQPSMNRKSPSIGDSPDFQPCERE